MITRNNKSVVKFFASIIGIIAFTDFILILINIFTLKPYDGINSAESILIIKFIFSVLIFSYLILWIKKPRYNIRKDILSLLLLIFFSLTLVYFLSLFVFKLSMINTVKNIIHDKIINGNPNLALDYSTKNYTSLSYVLSYYSGINSELVLLIELLFLEYFYLKSKKFETINEELVSYDSFIFKKSTIYFAFAYFIFAFLTLRVFSNIYNTLILLDIIVSSLGFILAIIPVILISRSYAKRYTENSLSYLSSTYKYIIKLLYLGSIIFGILTIYNIVLVFLDNSSFRLYTSLFSFLLSVILIVRSKKLLMLDIRAPFNL